MRRHLLKASPGSKVPQRHHILRHFNPVMFSVTQSVWHYWILHLNLLASASLCAYFYSNTMMWSWFGRLYFSKFPKKKSHSKYELYQPMYLSIHLSIIYLPIYHPSIIYHLPSTYIYLLLNDSICSQDSEWHTGLPPLWCWPLYVSLLITNLPSVVFLAQTVDYLLVASVSISKKYSKIHKLEIEPIKLSSLLIWRLTVQTGVLAIPNPF